MNSKSIVVKEILSENVDSALLHGYAGGLINHAHTFLRAFTLVDLANVNYADFQSLHEMQEGYSSVNIPEELTRKYITSHSWNHKSREECIKEGIYRYFTVTFSGALWKNRWFILKELTYYGDNMETSEIREYLTKNSYNEKFSDSDIFKPCNKQPIYGDPESYEFKEFGETPYLVALVSSQRNYI